MATADRTTATQGLSAVAFCRQRGLTSITFYKRRQALWQQATVAESAERFIKIQPPSTPVAATATTAVLRYHDS